MGTSQADIARALGLSKAAITKLKRLGMPVDTIEAARHWRHANLDPGRIKREPPAVRPTPSADAALRDLAELATVADAALKAGRFELIVPAMREALRAVPMTHRADVALPRALWDALVQPVAELIEASDGGPTSASEAAGMTDADADAMGRFWYGIAAGERVALP